MATQVLMPRSGQSVESCMLTKKHAAQGAVLTKGAPLFAYETDKAAFEEVAPEDGAVLAWLCEEGDDIPVLSPVCVIGAVGEEVDVQALMGERAPDQAEAQAVPEQSQAPAQPSIAASIGQAASAQPILAPSGDVRISPRARATAARLGVFAAQASPTGPEGRVIERDVLALYKDAPSRMADGNAVPDPLPEPFGKDAKPGMFDATGAYRDEKLSGIRRSIARAMTQSLASSAQLTNHASCDATALLAFRKRLKNSGVSELEGITITDLVLFAVARTLKKHPYLNAHVTEDGVRLFEHVNLGLAVDTPRGLMVPTLFGADYVPLSVLSSVAKDYAAMCQSGSISPDLLKNATFTVSNLGGLGVEMFTPVINPPQTGILGLCNIVERPRTGKNGIELYPALGLSLTYDHRVVDGAPAARFLKDLGEAIERIDLLPLMTGGGTTSFASDDIIAMGIIGSSDTVGVAYGR